MEQIAKTRLYGSFAFPFAVYMGAQLPRATVPLWLFVPQVFFLPAKRIQFSTNNTEQ